MFKRKTFFAVLAREWAIVKKRFNDALKFNQCSDLATVLYWDEFYEFSDFDDFSDVADEASGLPIFVPKPARRPVTSCMI